MKEKLILGSAGKPHPDAVTLDIESRLNPDVVHDLNIHPWPFKDNSFSNIIAHHVIEHLNDLSCMEELHRICKKDGVIYIEVPHHTSWLAPIPVHKLRFNYFAFNAYILGEETLQEGVKFKCIKREISFHKYYRMLFLHKFFNKHPKTYERFFCYIFPAEFLKLWLTPAKDA